MKRENCIKLFIGAFLLVLFVVFTALVTVVDVNSIGPNGSEVGFSSLNGNVRDAIGVNMILYNITDWLGLVPVFVMVGFAVLGLVQLMKRRCVLKVDKDILALGVFYVVVFFAYLLFEMLSINYRPTLIDGRLEASYPSSTTILVLCIMPTTAMQILIRAKNKILKIALSIICLLFMVAMLAMRILSGVHWFTDIIGGVLLSSALVLIYYSFVSELYFGQA